MAISVRVRFEVFKRDAFTCKYCGRQSPAVVLEVDHIVATARGGVDDPINLTTSCWECNRGKRDIPLSEVMTGEDPHDRALLLLERDRQLAEYNQVLWEQKARREEATWSLIEYWNKERGFTGEAIGRANTREYRWMLNALTFCPYEQMREFLDYALFRGFTDNLRYVMGCVRNWRAEKPEVAATTGVRTPITEPDERDPNSEEYYRQLAAESEADGEEYHRRLAAEEVLRLVREADFRRRNLGYCPHKPVCPTFMECLQRYVRGWLALDAS